MITGGSAVFSEDRRYRYVLTRLWDDRLPRCVFVGLNPSTADDRLDDPNIRRCVRFARDWGFGALDMVNLFAYRLTDPRDLIGDVGSIGPRNLEFLRSITDNAAIVVAAWGAHPKAITAPTKVALVNTQLHCLGTTKGGAPRHPLYVRADQRAELYYDPAGREAPGLVADLAGEGV